MFWCDVICSFVELWCRGGNKIKCSYVRSFLQSQLLIDNEWRKLGFRVTNCNLPPSPPLPRLLLLLLVAYRIEVFFSSNGRIACANAKCSSKTCVLQSTRLPFFWRLPLMTENSETWCPGVYAAKKRQVVKRFRQRTHGITFENKRTHPQCWTNLPAALRNSLVLFLGRVSSCIWLVQRRRLVAVWRDILYFTSRLDDGREESLDVVKFHSVL